MIKKMILLSIVFSSFVTTHGMEQTSSRKWHHNVKQRLKTRYYRHKLNLMVRIGHANDPKKYSDEEKKIKTSYFADYVAKNLLCKEDSDKRTFKSDPIFLYREKIPVVLPGGPYSGFLFSGEVRANFGDAKQEIINGNYIKCKDLVEIRRADRKRRKDCSIKNGTIVGSDGPYALSPIIIAGTCDDTKCEELREQFEKDMVWLARDSRLNKKHPFSVTSTFDIDDNGKFINKGDLIEANEDEDFMTKLSLNQYTLSLLCDDKNKVEW